MRAWVTTGPITVPFILALGIGVASIRSDKNSHDDSFGLVALCSIGPILSVMLLGVIFRPDSAGVQTYALVSISTTGELALQFLHAFPHYCREVALAVGPIALVFFLYNFLSPPVPPPEASQHPYWIRLYLCGAGGLSLRGKRGFFACG